MRHLIASLIVLAALCGSATVRACDADDAQCLRVEAEQARQEAEQARQEAEQARQEAEQARQERERAREDCIVETGDYERC